MNRFVFMAVCALLSVGVAASPRTYHVDHERSRVTIEVGKSGAFSMFAGHAHRVEAHQIDGTVALDPDAPEQAKVHLTIDASRLELDRSGESEDDAPKIQKTMVSEEVLDVARYPTITFVSTGVTIQHQTPASIEATVTGDVTLHGQTHPVRTPVTAKIEPDGLSVSGRFALKQTDYGIKPVTVAGVVSVKDTLNIQFTLVAR